MLDEQTGDSDAEPHIQVTLTSLWRLESKQRLVPSLVLSSAPDLLLSWPRSLPSLVPLKHRLMLLLHLVPSFPGASLILLFGGTGLYQGGAGGKAMFSLDTALSLHACGEVALAGGGTCEGV